MEKFNNYLKNVPGYYYLVFFIVGAFVVYGNTLGHSYALDDSIVITKNEFTKEGFKGISDILTTDSFRGFFGKDKDLVQGGRYRPFSIITFAIEYQFFGENPGVSHAVNVLLYGLLSCLIFLVVLKILFVLRVRNHMHAIAFISALIFLIHPVHTEVIANIKGRDEILSLLFSLLAFLVMLKKRNKILKPLFAILFIFLACMSKENAVAFVVIIPLFLMLKDRKLSKQVVSSFVVLLVGAGAFMLLRYNAVGGFETHIASELMNNPFLEATKEQRIATILYTWLIYFKLLVIPHPLTYDYYPYHIQIQNFGSVQVGMSLIMILAIAVTAFVTFRKRILIFFSIAGFVLSFILVSNLIFPVGTFMNERFLFMPSFFYSIVAACLLVGLFHKVQNKAFAKIIMVVTVLVFIGYSTKSVVRNKAWKNDFTLFTTDVNTSVNSAKSNCSAGGKLWEEAKVERDKNKQKEYYSLSEKYLVRSVSIYPEYVDAWLLLGNVKFDYHSDVKAASDCYLKVIEYQPANPNAWKNINIVLQSSGDRDLQKDYYHILERINPSNYNVNYSLGVLYGRFFNDLDEGIRYLRNAIQINTQSAEAYKDLGTSYGMKGNVEDAYNSFMKALELRPDDSQLYFNIGVALHQMGRIAEADEYMLKSKQLESK